MATCARPLSREGAAVAPRRVPLSLSGRQRKLGALADHVRSLEEIVGQLDRQDLRERPQEPTGRAQSSSCDLSDLRPACS